MNASTGFKEVNIGLMDASREGGELRKRRMEEKRRDKRMNWNIVIGESDCSLYLQYHQYHDMESGINRLLPSPSVDLTVS